MKAESFSWALALVSSLIQSSAATLWPRAFWMLDTISSILCLSFSGKYFATYIWPTASPSMLFGAAIALFQRGFCSCMPDIWREKNSKEAS